MALQTLTRRFEQKLEEVKAADDSKRRNLPLRLLKQQTHFIVPASRYAMLEKALNGCRPALDLLERAGLSQKEVLESLEIPEEYAKRVLEKPDADLILVDGEDGNSLDEKSIQEGRQNAIKIFTEGNWKDSLRFYRPTNALELPYCLDDLTKVLLGVAEKADGRFPVDGIIYPKPNHPEELAWVNDLLGELENKIGVPENSICLEFLAESAWAMDNLQDMAKTVSCRLSGIIFGKADYASELGIGSLKDDHPAILNSRIRIINTSAAWRVPSVDSMTFAYPVADKQKSPQENKKSILAKLRQVYEDTIHASDLGMDGKWVGHPLQLFMAKLAFLKKAEDVSGWIEKIRSYEVAGKGAQMIGDQMADRATDRQLRSMVQKAYIYGYVSEEEAKVFSK